MGWIVFYLVTVGVTMPLIAGRAGYKGEDIDWEDVFGFSFGWPIVLAWLAFEKTMSVPHRIGKMIAASKKLAAERDKYVTAGEVEVERWLASQYRAAPTLLPGHRVPGHAEICQCRTCTYGTTILLPVSRGERRADGSARRIRACRAGTRSQALPG